LVEKADVPKLQAESPIRGKGADRFQYHLVMEDAGGRHELTVSEDRIPGELRSVIERVKQASAE
jgi:hypothetical protein